MSESEGKILGKKGGQATLKKYGREHFVNIAKRRWQEEKTNIKKDHGKNSNRSQSNRKK